MKQGAKNVLHFGKRTRGQRRFRFGSLHGVYSHLYSSVRHFCALYYIWYFQHRQKTLMINSGDAEGMKMAKISQCL